MEESVPKSRSRKVDIQPEAVIQEIPARAKRQPKQVLETQPEPPEIKPKRQSKKAAPEPVHEAVIEPPSEPVKIKRVRKKPEPGSVPPKDITFTSAKGPINFTAYRQPYGHLHGTVNKYDHMMAKW